MHFNRLPIAAAAFSLLHAVTADEIELDADDIPTLCSAVCAPVKTLADTCDVSDDNGITDAQEDLLERQCFCLNTSFDVRSRTADCAACMHANNREREDNEDIDDIMRVCGFASVSAISSGSMVPTQTQSVTVQATRPTNVAQLTATVNPDVTAGQSSGNSGNQAGGSAGQTGTSGARGIAPLVVGLYCVGLVAAGMILVA